MLDIALRRAAGCLSFDLVQIMCRRDHRAGRQLIAAVLAIGITGVAIHGAGSLLGITHLGLAVLRLIHRAVFGAADSTFSLLVAGSRTTGVRTLCRSVAAGAFFPVAVLVMLIVAVGVCDLADHGLLLRDLVLAIGIAEQLAANGAGVILDVAVRKVGGILLFGLVQSVRRFRGHGILLVDLRGTGGVGEELAANRAGIILDVALCLTGSSLGLGFEQFMTGLDRRQAVIGDKLRQDLSRLVVADLGRMFTGAGVILGRRQVAEPDIPSVRLRFDRFLDHIQALGGHHTVCPHDAGMLVVLCDHGIQQLSDRRFQRSGVAACRQTDVVGAQIDDHDLLAVAVQRKGLVRRSVRLLLRGQHTGSRDAGVGDHREVGVQLCRRLSGIAQHGVLVFDIIIVARPEHSVTDGDGVAQEFDLQRLFLGLRQRTAVFDRLQFRHAGIRGGAAHFDHVRSTGKTGGQRHGALAGPDLDRLHRAVYDHSQLHHIIGLLNMQHHIICHGAFDRKAGSPQRRGQRSTAPPIAAADQQLAGIVQRFQRIRVRRIGVTHKATDVVRQLFAILDMRRFVGMSA